jgi:hypothetical protein
VQTPPPLGRSLLSFEDAYQRAFLAGLGDLAVVKPPAAIGQPKAVADLAPQHLEEVAAFFFVELGETIFNGGGVK